MRDKGNVLSDECKGDVKVVFNVENNSKFTRKGLDLIYKKELSLKEALCGFSFKFDLIDGRSITLNNKGTVTKPGCLKKIDGIGMVRDEHKGNVIIEFNIIFPNNLSEDQTKQLAEIL